VDLGVEVVFVLFRFGLACSGPFVVHSQARLFSAKVIRKMILGASDRVLAFSVVPAKSEAGLVRFTSTSVYDSQAFRKIE